MKTIWILSGIVSPMVVALIALIVLNHYGIAGPRVVIIVIVSAVALAIGNGIFIIIQLAKG